MAGRVELQLRCGPIRHEHYIVPLFDETEVF
jgi:hypothetical protein